MKKRKMDVKVTVKNTKALKDDWLKLLILFITLY